MIDKFDGKNSFLSNFHPCKVVHNGMTFDSVEHAFQAAKTDNLQEKLDIQKCDSPGKAKRLGKKVKLRSSWELEKLEVMEQLLIQKFSTGELKAKLLATGDCELVEGNWWGDTFFGVCKGIGQNRLGKLLMKIREELRNDSLLYNKQDQQ